MTNVIIYSDFDGTITRKVGLDTVNSPFYQSLLLDYKPGKTQKYATAYMKNAVEVQRLFEEKFGIFNQFFNWEQADADMLMTKEAVRFFKEILKNPKVKVNIVTRNRRDYILALMKYQGFSDNELSQLIIFDTGYKYDDVSTNLQLQTSVCHLYIFDDSKSDFNDMMKAAQESVLKHEIHGFSEAVGTFSWDNYLSEIQNLTKQKESKHDQDQTPKKYNPIKPLTENSQNDKQQALKRSKPLTKNSQNNESQSNSKPISITREQLAWIFFGIGVVIGAGISLALVMGSMAGIGIFTVILFLGLCSFFGLAGMVLSTVIPIPTENQELDSSESFEISHDKKQSLDLNKEKELTLSFSDKHYPQILKSNNLDLYEEKDEQPSCYLF